MDLAQNLTESAYGDHLHMIQFWYWSGPGTGSGKSLKSKNSYKFQSNKWILLKICKNLPMVTIYRWFNFSIDPARKPAPGSL